ncbi:MAG: polysaccharide deacetylase family protein [Paludibacteraceae bacterium]|nr:polysaccharide deacetylase family protein [Paludibacteraceae bacterium]
MVKLRDIWQTLYPYGIFRTGKAVYLTFDDGPIPEVTPKVLAILDRYHIKATFFMVGENIDKHPDIFAQVVQAGHAIGNHTYNHLKGWSTPFHQYMANVAQWENAVNRQSIVPRQSSNRQLFRPPYGKATLRQRIALHRLGYRLIYWDILTRDYEAMRTPQAMLEQIQRETRPGSIINFHDSLKSNERMLTVLPQAIEWLQQQGYEIKTL